MRELLDSIIEAKYRVGRFYRENPVRPLPGEPASQSDLERLDIHLASQGLHAPESYRLALSVYNGVKHMLANEYSLLSLDAVVNHDYDLLPEMHEYFPSCCRFVLAAGNTSAFIGFDVDAPASDGGYEVVSITPEGTSSRKKNFQEFLEGYRAALQRKIASEEKDRQGLTDAEVPNQGGNG
jgi:hypothetical protein